MKIQEIIQLLDIETQKIAVWDEAIAHLKKAIPVDDDEPVAELEIFSEDKEDPVEPEYVSLVIQQIDEARESCVNEKKKLMGMEVVEPKKTTRATARGRTRKSAKAKGQAAS